MAVVPVSHDANGVTINHAEKDHTAVLPWSAVRFGTRMASARAEDDRAVLVLACPVAGCGSETAHPLGDAAPELVRAVAAELGKRTPPGPRPKSPQEEAGEEEARKAAGLPARLAEAEAAIAALAARLAILEALPSKVDPLLPLPSRVAAVEAIPSIAQALAGNGKGKK